MVTQHRGPTEKTVKMLPANPNLQFLQSLPFPSSLSIFLPAHFPISQSLLEKILHWHTPDTSGPTLDGNLIVPATNPLENMTSPDDNSNWLLDYITVPGGEFPSLQEPPFNMSFNSFTCSTDLGVEFEDSIANVDANQDSGSRKRGRNGSFSASDSKACKEKLRRDRLNDRFQELSSILEPGSTPKTDKAVILSDAVRIVNQLRDEALKLKEDYRNLQAKINELKVEKSELRDEKQKLKVEKEKLEQQVRSLSTQTGFLPHPSAIPAPLLPPSQVVGAKLVPLVGYSGVPMWQFIPPAAADTSEDHVLRPPVA